MNKNILSTKFLWGLFFIALAFILCLSSRLVFDHDEFESIHVAWKIFTGQKIYVDFFEHHEAFFYYLLVGFVALFKENVDVLFAARGFIFLMILLIFFVVYHMASKLFGKESARIGLILLASNEIFILKAVEIRPDVPQTLFGLLAVSLLFDFFRKGSLKDLVLSSISLGVSLLFIQKSVLFAGVIGMVLLFSACLNRIKFREVFLYLVVCLATLMPYYLCLALNGQLHAYLRWCWIFASHILHWEAPLITLWTLMRNFQTDFMLILCFLSLFFLDTQVKKKMGAISLLFLIILIWVQAHRLQYFLPLMPLLAIMAGYAVYNLAGLSRKYRWFIVWTIMVIYVLCPFRSYLKIMTNSPNNATLEKVRYVLSITTSQDYVYDGNIRFNLFRKDPGFFWFTILDKMPSGRKYYDIYQAIDMFKPKVISSYLIPDMKDERVSLHYRMSDRYKDLFIRTKG